MCWFGSGVPSTSMSSMSGGEPSIVVITVSGCDAVVSVPVAGCTMVGPGTVKQTSVIVASTLALGAGLTSAVPVQTWVGKSTRASVRVVALDGTLSVAATPTVADVLASQPGPLPTTTC